MTLARRAETRDAAFIAVHHVSPMSKDFSISKPIAPEDIRPGMYVIVHLEIHEQRPSIFCDDASMRKEPARMARWPCMCSDCAGGEALKVLNVCLPYIMVQRPAGEQRIRTLDTRQHRLVQASESYGRAARRIFAKPKANTTKRKEKSRSKKR
jgi:hypothetical protein